MPVARHINLDFPFSPFCSRLVPCCRCFDMSNQPFEPQNDKALLVTYNNGGELGR
jgi:hypothetical protein